MAKDKKFNEIGPLKERASEIKLLSKELIEEGKKIEEKIKNTLVEIPNIPHNSVPDGKTEKDNFIESQWGDILDSDKLLPHWELAEKYNIIDFKKGAEITGSGFPLYKGMGANTAKRTN